MLNRIVNRIRREVRFKKNLRLAKERQISYTPPNYAYKDRLDSNSVVIDVGCADDPDLSLFMMESFGVTAFAVDPTRRHAPRLAAIQEEHQGRFTHLQLAVAGTNGTMQFHESSINLSGSLFATHTNVQNDPTRSYDVETVTIPELLNRVGADHVAYLKLDLEGAEYALLKAVSADDLARVDQLLVEFHDYCIPEFSRADSLALVKRVASFGYRSFELDDHTFLFWRGD